MVTATVQQEKRATTTMSQKRKQHVAFSVIISPEKRKKNEVEEIVAVLAPFNAFPKVCFEQVKIGTTASRDVILSNPTNNEIHVELTKLPEIDRGFQWSSTQFVLPSQSETVLTIYWTPSVFGNWRDNVKILNKKNNKIISELVLIYSSEEPPKVSKRCLRSQSQSAICGKLFKQPSLSKQTSVGSIKFIGHKNISENKENIVVLESKREHFNEENVQNKPLIKVRKDLTVSQQSSVVDDETERLQKVTRLSSTITSQQFSSLSDKHNLKKSLAIPHTVTSNDSNELSLEHSIPRRTTYDVLDPVSSRRSTYSLRNKRVTSTNDLEAERITFEKIASPRVFSDSLEIAASKLFEDETTVKEVKQNWAEDPGTTFVINKNISPQVTEKCENLFRRTTYEVVPPSIISRKSSSRLGAISENLLNAEQNIQPRRCLESVSSSELYDSLEDDKLKLGKEDILAELDDYFNQIDFNSIDDKSSKTLKSPKTLFDEIEDFNNLSSSSRKSIECNLSPKVLVADIKRLSDKFNINLSETVNLNKTYTPVKCIDGELGSSGHLPLSLSNKPYNENTNMDTLVAQKPSECQENVDIYHENISIKENTANNIVQGRKQFDGLSTDTTSDNIMKHNDLSSNHSKPKNSQVSVEVMAQNIYLDRNKSVETGYEYANNCKTEESKFSDMHPTPNVVVKLEPLVWDVSPPVKATLDSLPVKKSMLRKTMASLKSSPKVKRVGHTVAKHILPLNTQVIKGTLESLTSTTPSNKKPNTHDSELSSEMFVVPSIRFKLPSTIGTRLNNDTPSKLSRTAEDGKVKRLSTPYLRKSIVAGGSKERPEVPRSLPRFGNFSSRKRKTQKVAEWLPVRKLRLSTRSEQGYPSSPVIDSSIDFAAPDPFLAATTLNPFIEGDLYMSDEWLQEQEWELINWASRMLRPPGELELDRDHTSGTLHRLNALRATAFSLLMSPDTVTILKKVKLAVERKIICIRTDKQLHVDLGLQEIVVSLLMSYNPLWLRLCLEAIYQCTINLKRHSDSAGLVNFIRRRVISDEFLKESCSHPSVPNMMLPEFEEKMKKFTLYKFLVLVYLLDLVKRKKVMIHDPCLFRKDSKYKSSKEILIQFNKEFIAGAGDITRVLRLKGYEVSHVQTHLDEFDFTFNDRSELRDGVRLTKLAEILVGDNSLCSKLRVPAISCLQKKFNADVAITALKNAGYDLPQNISPRDISDGHKEKTLSLLWHLRGVIQKRAVTLIILKWRETSLLRRDRRHYLQMKNAVIKIQKWYRKQKKTRDSCEEIEKGKRVRKQYLQLRSAVITVQRNFRAKKERQEKAKRNSAATIIQKWYKIKKSVQKDQDNFRKLKNSVVKIQRAYRRYKKQQEGQNSQERIQYIKILRAVLVIQKRFRETLTYKRERTEYLKIKNATLLIQRRYKAYAFAKLGRTSFLSLKIAVLYVQRKYRANKLSKEKRQFFLSLREATVYVQRKYRANKLARDKRQFFLSLKEATVYVQRKYRANKLAREERQCFLSLREATVYVQRKYRANKLAREERQCFLSLREATVYVQRKYRTNKLAREERQCFQSLREATVYVQRKYRANKLARENKQCFLSLREATVYVQRKYRANKLAREKRKFFLSLKEATVYVQRKYSATKLAREERQCFLSLREATVYVQRKYRANKLAREERQCFLSLREATVYVQRKYRANKLAREERQCFLSFREATVYVQRKYRANKLARENRQCFLSLKEATVYAQRKYRANKLARENRRCFLSLREGTVYVQRKYRANKLSREKRQFFLSLREATVYVQIKYKANKLAREKRQFFLSLKEATVYVQRKYRANKLAREKRQFFLSLKEATVYVQRKYRANKLAREERQCFLSLREATVYVQRKYRANKLAREERQCFLSLREATVYVQRRYRTNTLAREERQCFQSLREATVYVQRKYRANKLAREKKQCFLSLKEATVYAQRKYRANKLAREERQRFLSLRDATVYVQRKYRANKLAREKRQCFLSLREATVCVQRKYRANRLARENRQCFLSLREATVYVQRKYRANKLSRENRQCFLSLREATVYVQRMYRTNKVARENRQCFLSLREATVYVQRKYRANKLAREKRQCFLSLREATVYAQRKYRANKLAREEKQCFLSLREATIYVQRKYRANKLAREKKQCFLSLREATVYLQRKYRANKLARENRQCFLSLREATVYVQRKYRANKLSRENRQCFLSLREATVYVQRMYRANKLARENRQCFLSLREATVCVQRKYRSNKLSRENRQCFLSLREATVYAQRKYRAKKLARENRQCFLSLRVATVYVQRKYRANKLARENRQCFLSLREATVCVQRKYRANKLAREERQFFLSLRDATVYVQRKYRANKLAREERQCFLSLREATIYVQRKYRANKLAREKRQCFLSLIEATVYVQRKYRANRLAREKRLSFLSLKEAAVCIQRKFIANKLAREERQCFQSLRKATVYVQRKYRANKLAREKRQSLLLLGEAAVFIQRKYMANKLAREKRQSFLSSREAAVYIQRKYRANKLAREKRQSFLSLREAAVYIQRKFRANKLAREKRQSFLSLREATVFVQRRFRATKYVRAVVSIQRIYRSKCITRRLRYNFLIQRAAAVCIQRRFRLFSIAKTERQKFLKLRRAVIFVQRTYRAIRQDRNQAHVDSIDTEIQKRISAALKIQAMWRGHMIRRRVVVPRPNVHPSDEERSLLPIATRGSKILPALKELHKLSVAQLQRTLYNLDIVTSLSADQCDYFVKNGAVKILYNHVCTLNKAFGVDRCIELILLTLINLYRAPHTSETVWQETVEANGITHLVELMMNFRLEKTSTVFCKACTALWILAHDPVKAEIIKNSSKVVHTLKYIKKMEKTRPSTSKKPVTPTKKVVVPAVLPNWGNYYKHPRAFVDKDFAFASVTKLLNLL